ncbi:MAG: ParB/RepB/Spo0J family partition protein [Bradymonadaceae bacterium]|nr:ParB/RepB/Spo0J family partition protein [Lujinxingiaceae bacterium]
MSQSDGRRNALGKGLGALIPKSNASSERREFIRLPLDRIDTAAKQPRAHFDARAIEELAASIRESGLIQPLVVREKNGRFELIAGERRLRACKVAGLTDVPVVIKDVSDVQAYTLALIENIQREDLNALEEANAFEKLLSDSGLTQSELARQVGKSRAAVANSVRLLQLPAAVQDLVIVGALSAGHARSLLGLEAEQAAALAERVVAENWSVRETEQLVRELKDGITLLSTFDEKEDAPLLEEEPARDQRPRYRDDAQIRDMTSRLQQTIGAKVKIKDSRGKGRIEIYYENYEGLQSVLEALGLAEEEP